MNLYFTRHGHRQDAPNNPAGAYLPKGRDLDPDISSIGVKQAQQTGQRLKDAGIKHVYCSPFLRAVHTASEIVSQWDEKPEIRLDWGFSEHLNAMYFVDWPGTICPQKLAEMFPLVNPYFKQSGILPLCPEDYWVQHDRVIKATNIIVERHQPETVLIVAHCATVCAIAPGLTGWPGYEGKGFLCGLCKAVKQEDKWVLELNSDTSHLDYKGL